MRCQFHFSERHNLHDDLCLIDATVISFGGESLLNALLYGSDEFNDKINREILLCIASSRADNTGMVEGGPCPSTILFSKNKKGKQKGKRVSVKAESTKRMSQGQSFFFMQL